MSRRMVEMIIKWAAAGYSAGEIARLVQRPEAEVRAVIARGRRERA
jgi:DNA-directed RNA polymerase specialized sigma24 family protein